jgi:hypothetical protein
MSVRRGFLIVAALAPALALPLDSGAAKRHSCNPKGSRMIVGDRVARVFDVRSSDGFHAVFGCLLRTGRETYLGDEYHDSPDSPAGEVTRPVALRGHWVAAAVVDVDRSSGTFSRVSVRDLRTGRRRHFWRRGGNCGPETEVTAIRVSARGSAGWIAKVGSECHDNIHWEVFKADGRRRRGARSLDGGTQIAPHFLKLRNGTLTWKSGAETRSAPVRP